MSSWLQHGHMLRIADSCGSHISALFLKKFFNLYWLFGPKDVNISILSIRWGQSRGHNQVMDLAGGNPHFSAKTLLCLSSQNCTVIKLEGLCVKITYVSMLVRQIGCEHPPLLWLSTLTSWPLLHFFSTALEYISKTVKSISLDKYL